eukprot:c9240_g1_i1.p1 GENE.c9240_g1_i1~~c9240_g1_i1.p1  ORF type:complete len:342 (-),score=70.09 c9240_g1_i1:192-1217(-)
MSFLFTSPHYTGSSIRSLNQSNTQTIQTVPLFTSALSLLLSTHLPTTQYKCVYGIWLVPISEILNGLLKWHYHVPRPAWVDPSIRLNEWSDEYSFPSSHSQIVWALANFFTFTSVGELRAKMFGKFATTALMYWYLLVCPYLLAAIVSLSRVYDGLHYPRDVVVGAGVGVMLSALYIELLPFALRFLRSLGLLQRILVMLAFPAILYVAICLAYRRVSRESKVLPEWTKNASRAKFKGKVLSPHDVPLASYTAMVGVLSGLAVAVNIKQFAPLEYPKTVFHALLRLILGNIGLLTMFLSIRNVEKAQREQWRIQLVSFIRYASLPIYILFLIPPVFNLLGI